MTTYTAHYSSAVVAASAAALLMADGYTVTVGRANGYYTVTVHDPRPDLFAGMTRPATSKGAM